MRFSPRRVTVWLPDGQRAIVREDGGAAGGFAKTAGEAMQNALKAAETDALRAGERRLQRLQLLPKALKVRELSRGQTIISGATLPAAQHQEV